MNVLHVHSGNMFGGVERMLQALAPRIAGTSPVASSYALCFEGRTADALRAEGGTVHRLGTVRARRPDEIRRARRALRGVLERERPDVAIVHSAWSQAIFGSAILDDGTPLVRWLHSPQPGPRWLEAWAALSRPSLILCNSRYTLETAAGRPADVPSVVMYPPAVPLTASSGSRSAVRNAFGTPDTAVVVMLAARLEAGKGHAQLIDALAALESSRWEAWIVGGVQQEAESAYLAALQKQAVEAGASARVRFLGERTDIAELLSAADVYCQPNVAPDSFGLSFVEALASGLPVITTRLGGAPEIVDDTCGILVPPGGAVQVTAALRALIDDDGRRARLAAAARARARTFCDVQGSVGRLAEVLSRGEHSVALA
ncbi:MAG TPA: glycosyltransferase [Vicinamibacterales bacterium]